VEELARLAKPIANGRPRIDARESAGEPVVASPAEVDPPRQLTKLRWLRVAEARTAIPMARRRVTRFEAGKEDPEKHGALSFADDLGPA
jgi:hypothetical protein